METAGVGITNIVPQSLPILVHSNGYYSAVSAGLWLLAPPTGSLIKHSVGGVQGLQLLLLMTQVLYFAKSLHGNSWTPPTLLNSPLQWIRAFIQEPFDWIISNENSSIRSLVLTAESNTKLPRNNFQYSQDPLVQCWSSVPVCSLALEILSHFWWGERGTERKKIKNKNGSFLGFHPIFV